MKQERFVVELVQEEDGHWLATVGGEGVCEAAYGVTRALAAQRALAFCEDELSEKKGEGKKR